MSQEEPKSLMQMMAEIHERLQGCQSCAERRQRIEAWVRDHLPKLKAEEQRGIRIIDNTKEK